jgi:hypothetical protein
MLAMAVTVPGVAYNHCGSAVRDDPRLGPRGRPAPTPRIPRARLAVVLDSLVFAAEAGAGWILRGPSRPGRGGKAARLSSDVDAEIDVTDEGGTSMSIVLDILT